MADTAFRVYYNNQPATRAQLDQIDEITVDQSRDMAWEARLRIPAVLDERGAWSGKEEYMKPFARVRVEIRVQSKTFVPLIDGPVAGYENDLHSEPGRSWITLVVHDDSVYLDQETKLEKFEQKTDHELATELFKQADQIAQPAEVDGTPQAPDALSPVFMQRGTPIQVLRLLAKRNGMYVCVRPGKSAGEKSIGEFKALPVKKSGLPDMVLTGGKRNVKDFRVQHNGRKSAKYKTAVLNFKDKTITTAVSDLTALDRLGDETPYGSEGQVAVRWFHPSLGDTQDPDHAVNAAAAAAGYSLQAKGSVIGSAYPGVLQPFRVVAVRGVNTALTGNYMITRVTHRLTRPEYAQDFEAVRNALTPDSGGEMSLSGAGRTDINTWGGLC